MPSSKPTWDPKNVVWIVQEDDSLDLEIVFFRDLLALDVFTLLERYCKLQISKSSESLQENEIYVFLCVSQYPHVFLVVHIPTCIGFLLKPNWWLVGGLEHGFIFPYIGNSNPNWVIFLGLKPPIRWSFWISPNSSVMCWRWGKIAIGSRVNNAVLQLQLEQRPSGSRENPRPDVWRRLHGLLIRWSCNLTACWRRKNMLKTTCALWMLILCETGKSQVRRCTKFGKFPLLNSRGYSVPFLVMSRSVKLLYNLFVSMAVRMERLASGDYIPFEKTWSIMCYSFVALP